MKKSEQQEQKQSFSEFEEYRHLMDEWSGIVARRNEIAADVRGLETTLANKGSFGSRISQAAKALLSKAGIGSTEPSSEELQQKLRTAREQLRIHEEAIQQLRLAQNELEDRLSKVIAQGLLPKHRELVKAIADAVVQLEKANQAEAAFRESLSEAGIRYGSYIRAMQFPGVGKISDMYSEAFAFLKECRDECKIDGLDQFFVSPVQRGKKIQIVLRYPLCGPEGSFSAGSVISTDMGGYLLRTNQAFLPDGWALAKAAAKRDALKHDALMSGKEEVLIPADSEWVPTK